MTLIPPSSHLEILVSCGLDGCVRAGGRGHMCWVVSMTRVPMTGREHRVLLTILGRKCPMFSMVHTKGVMQVLEGSQECFVEASKRGS